MEKTVVIINPQSASGKTGKRWPRVAPKLLSVYPNAELLMNKESGEAATLAKNAVIDGANRVIAVGGDGTINEVLNGLIGSQGKPLNSNVSLGVIPMGTGSDLSRSLAIPKDPDLAIEALKSPAQPVDCGWAEVNGKGRAFLNIGSLGISSEVARHFEEYGKSGIVSYVSGLMRSAQRYSKRAFTLRFLDDDGSWQERQLPKAFVLAVGNGQYFGGGMHITPQAHMSDGSFQCVLVRDLTTLEIIRYLPSLFRGLHLKHAPFQSVFSKEVEVTVSHSTFMELDGEPTFELTPSSPGRIRVIPKAIRIHTGERAPALC